MGTSFYGSHHIIAVLIPLNWFGRRLRLKDITTAILVEVGLEWKS
jgi:hypothetical protein